jgi:metallo-beta-lactamase family protein
MKLTFWGAARQVTGSMFLLELDDDYRILIDCGTEMARDREEAHEMLVGSEINNGTSFPFDPSSINLVLLTHAHIDHSGNLPNLVRHGYEGQILCTAATHSLTQLLLLDSASLHRRRLKSIHHSKRSNSRRITQDTSQAAEMFLEQHVDETVERFVTIAFKHRFKIKSGVWITFIPTGHLLGAANILLEIEENGQLKKIGFSGDVGRRNYPLLPDPEPFPEVDYLLCESTYGNRRHKAQGTPEDILADVIKRTCIDIPGRLIIPAFSVGRTQALLYVLNKLYTERGFTPIRVFSDSPMALKSTEIHQKFVKLLNKEAQEFNEEHDELFDFDNLHFVENMEQSRHISSYHEPSIIISSSGMVNGGRVEDHIRKNIQNPYCTILMVGFAAEGTLGHRLVHGQKTLRVGDKDVPIMANVEHTDVFSGHADLDDLLAFVKQQNPAKLKKLFVVHGEYETMLDYKATLHELGYENVEIPKKGQTFLL